MDRLNEVQAGSKATAKWANQVVDELRRLKIVPGNGIRVTVTASGTVIALKDEGSSGSSGGGGMSDVIPCITDSPTLSLRDGYAVTLYANGFGEGSTGNGQLYLPEVATHTTLPAGTSVLAHICQANYTQSDSENEDIGD
jgi:hypothetical protein